MIERIIDLKGGDFDLTIKDPRELASIDLKVQQELQRIYGGSITAAIITDRSGKQQLNVSGRQNEMEQLEISIGSGELKELNGFQIEGIRPLGQPYLRRNPRHRNSRLVREYVKKFLQFIAIAFVKVVIFPFFVCWIVIKALVENRKTILELIAIAAVCALVLVAVCLLAVIVIKGLLALADWQPVKDFFAWTDKNWKLELTDQQWWGLFMFIFMAIGLLNHYHKEQQERQRAQNHEEQERQRRRN
ncbi:MAG: hypothetical protein N4J56_006999 [Chroococcidiopsis sp. SAG 2025]|uniref:hypothetical protein n=1 Tax=Chroococcidiopsis sp. SAG 2025 TaxID=171389 RepID=UPI0029372C94|nr:hypothetical protein [Chroococcidiopsis sp. SAG 2025]MDV2997294.1 hypothetical protein [Chroococcidiopsis sp. SAG 2025]